MRLVPDASRGIGPLGRPFWARGLSRSVAATMPEAPKERKVVGNLRSSNFESRSFACLSRSRNLNLEPQAWNQDLRVSSMYFVGERRLGVFGALLGRPGALLGRPGAFLGRLGELGPSKGLLKPSWALLGGSNGLLGGLPWLSWVSLASLLGASWAPFGQSWGSLGQSWGPLGPS